MIGKRVLKTVVFAASSALLLSIPTMYVHAQTENATEEGIAGVAALLETSTPDNVKDAYKATIEILSLKPESPYANLGVSKANDYVNIRKEPSTDSEIVGKLYRGNATNILEKLDSGWVKIESGEVKGYIDSTYLAIGEAAESMFDEYATKYATVTTTTLFVREEPSTEARKLTMIPKGETYIVIKEHDEWVEILLGNDDDTGEEFTGFVSKDYVDITIDFNYAISIEEENRIKAEEAEALRAEAERQQKLAEEKAEREEADRLKAEQAAQQKAEEAHNSSNNSSSNSSNSSSNDNKEEEETAPSTDSSSASELRSEIVAYALKFVGNRYVWGGESLTKGADCSGFTQAIYEDFGYRIPRVSRDQAVSAGKSVSVSDIKPGDLIFYANSRGTVNHVAMYIGNGMIVHAANSRQGIITSNYKYRDIKCVRRIIN